MQNPSTAIRRSNDRTVPAGRLPVAAGVGKARPLYLGSEMFRRAAFGQNHPLRIMRHSAVFDLLHILGWLPDAAFREIEPATVEQLLEFHDRGYIEALQYADSAGTVAPEVRQRYKIGTLENPFFPGVFQRAATTVGGSILAAELACEGHVIFHPSGGTHHGRPDRASGFCYFNDPVFAIRTFLQHGKQHVLYLDLDAHHGDGVEDAFVGDTRVMTVSIHEDERWPYTGRAGDRRSGGARNLPVPDGVNDSELAWLMDHAVMPLADDFRADAMVICCGADCLAGDPLSGMQLSNVALWHAVARLLALDRPTVVLGGGGYNPWTVSRYWAGLWGIINGLPIPDTLPAAAVDMLRGMECDLIDDDDLDPTWLTTMADSPYPGPVREAIKSVASMAIS